LGKNKDVTAHHKGAGLILTLFAAILAALKSLFIALKLKNPADAKCIAGVECSV